MRVVALALTVIGLLRLFLFVGAEPVRGYANQYDMTRVSACLDLWPRGSSNPAAATPDGPLRWYERREVAGARCYPSSEVMLGGWMYSLFELVLPQAVYDVRTIGFSKALSATVAVAIGVCLLWVSAGALLFHGLVVAGLLFDPINLLYLNTLYGEFSALLGSYLALTAIMASMVRGKLGHATMAALLVGLAVLMTSKMQHFLLPFVFLATFFFLAPKGGSSRRQLGVILISATLLGLFQWRSLARTDEGIQHANLYNTAFLTVLPAMPDQRRAIDQLGLRAECRLLVGTSWFQRRGLDHEQVCPEVHSISRIALIRLLILHPDESLKLLTRSIYQSGAWMLDFLGHVEGRPYGHIDDGDSWESVNLGGIPRVVSFFTYTSIIVGPAVFLAVYGLVAVIRRRRTEEPGRKHLLALLLLAVAGAASTWLTSLLGDGFSDLSKHLHLAINLLLLGWLVVAALIVREAVWLRSGQAAAAKVAACASIIALLSWGISRQPLALGTVDPPSGRSLASDSFQLSGWVKDPFGVEAVIAEVEGVWLRGRITGGALDVDRMFPLATAHPGQRFLVDVAVPEKAGWFEVAIIVANSIGIETRVDSIWFYALPRQGEDRSTPAFGPSSTYR